MLTFSRANGAAWQATLLVAGVAGAVLLAFDSLVLLVSDWFSRGEYSHGLLVPVLSVLLLWPQRKSLVEQPRRPAIGIAFALLGLAVALLGKLSTIHALTQYGFVTILIGLFYVWIGIGSWRRSLVPLLLLYFMVPLPHFLHQMLSGELQLLSSQLGVALIRGLGISVYLQGNVIDLGVYQLQVLEACDGLRYLFPLMTLGLALACIYQAPLWARVLLFVVTVPLTVLMNGLRIGLIGLMVEYYGPQMAEGLLHDAQGWLMFLICVAILLWLGRWLARMSGDRRPLVALFRLPEDEGPGGSEWLSRAGARTAAVTTFAVGVIATSAHLAAQGIGAEAVADPEIGRREFVDFPLSLGQWDGRWQPLDRIYLDELKLSDYLQANFQHASGSWSNLYIAYYADQISGRSVHSPRTCLPGDGWEMQSFETQLMRDAEGTQVPVNRVLIGKGPRRQLVYYWFEQRGRLLANELSVKYYLLRDTLQSGRSDGAMVRLIMPLPLGQGRTALADAESKLTDLFREVRQQLPEFVPS